MEAEAARDMEKKYYEHINLIQTLREEGLRIMRKLRHRSANLNELERALSLVD